MRTKLLIFAALLLCSTIFFCIFDLPTPPPGPEKATVELGFELPNGEQVKTTSFTDSLGFKTKICMNLHLTHYIDSIVLIIFNDLNFADTFSFNSYPSSGSDAIVKQPIVLPAAGKYSIILTGYVEEQQPRVVAGTIIIIPRQQPVQNQKPVLGVPVIQKVGAGQTVMFKVSATDPDTNQKVTIFAYKKPDAAIFEGDSFKWTPVMADTGLYTAVFYAVDNVVPPLSDTDSVYIVISPNPVNRAPVWVSKNVKESAQVGEPFSYDLSSRCYDLDYEKLTFALRVEPPVNDTIIGNAYTFTPAASDAGKQTIHVTVRDTSGLEDTLTLELTVKNSSGIDTIPPVFTRVSKDSTVSTLSIYKVSVLCSDAQSGVDSVKCYSGTSSFDVTKTGDSLYTATVTGLSIGWNTITFIAQDASTAKNPCTLLVHIKYEKDPVDKKPPVITFMSPSKDTVIAADSFEIKVSCIDDSGCSVKGYRDGTTLSLKKSATVANLWTGMAKGIAAGSYSTIKIVATDSSAAKNKDSLTVRIKYDNDRIGPVVTLVQPSTKSTATNSSSFSIELKYTDASGISSVKGAIGANTVSGVRSGDNWIVTMNNLVLGNNTIIITAIDSSSHANEAVDTFNVKYDPTIEDTVAPTIKQIGVPTSGSIVSSAVVEITDSISDPSGIDSAYWIHNGSKKMMTPVSGKTDLYSLKDTLREGILDSLVVTAYDKAAHKNFRRQVVALTYIVPPSITKQPLTQSVCSGAPAVFSITAAGTGLLTYQWRTGAVAPFTNIGSNSPVCTLSTTTTTILSCVVSNQAPTNATSSLCTLSVNVPAGTPAGKATPDTVLLGDNKSVTLSVTAGSPGTGGSWVWYASDKATKVSANPFTPASTATYFVRSENAACGVGAWSSAVQVIVNQPAGTPTGKATPASVCLGDLQAVTLSIVNGDPGTGGSWVWYASDKVTKITANPFTPSSTGISTYYVRSEGGVSGAGTWSAGIQVTVNQPAGVPTGTATPSSVCFGSTQQVTLSATGTTGTGGSWVWYESDQTTKVTANPFTPTATKSYYARSEGSACGVGPWSGSAVTVTVSQPATAPTSITASPQSICGSGTSTLTVIGGSLGTGGATWKWYTNSACTVPAGSGASITPTVTSQTTYYVRAEGGSCNVSTATASTTINVVTAPTAPTSITPSASSVCGGGQVELTVNGGSLGTGGATWKWYTNSACTVPAGSGASITPTVTSQTTYYVRAEGGSCNVSTATANTTINVVTAPTAPTSITPSVSSVCGSGQVILTVNGGSLGTGGATWKWYTNSACTVPAGSGASITPTVTSQTTYYVRAEGGSCNVSTATASTTINVVTAPTAPTSITPSASSVCGGGQVELTVNGGSLGTGGATWKWYTNSACTVPAGSGVSITPTVTVTTTFYVRAEGGICNTATATANTTITIGTVPSAPTINYFGETAANHVWVEIDSRNSNIAYQYCYTNDGGTSWTNWQNSGYLLSWPDLGPSSLAAGMVKVRARVLNTSGCYSAVTERTYTPAPKIELFGELNGNVWAQINSQNSSICYDYSYSNDGGATWSAYVKSMNPEGTNCYIYSWPTVGPSGLPSGYIKVRARVLGSDGIYSNSIETTYTY